MKHMEDKLKTKLKDVLKEMQKGVMNETSYFGIKALKMPLDSWVYQQIIYETRPDVIVEVGAYLCGGTLSLAHMLDNVRHGRVIGIENEGYPVPEIVKAHPRIKIIRGDACGSFEQVRCLIKGCKNIMVIEDSSHEYQNTLNVLNTYSKLIPIGGYLIVEDGICHHGLKEGPKPGPYEAVQKFLKENKNFVADREREQYLITWNPMGYLRRIA